MMKFFGVFTILIYTSGGLAGACPEQQAAVSLPALPPLTMAGGMYYCANSSAPETVGDLAAADWAKHVQVCTTNCSYMANNPGDPHSVLIPVDCGRGVHETAYLVVPPPPPSGRTALKVATTGCRGYAPSKAPPAPAAPAPSPRP